MTNKDYTAIKVVMDRSGSMSFIRDDAEGALEEFIRGQIALPGRATISISQFDTEYDEVYKSVDVDVAPKYTLNPRGGTALNDAMGRAITEFGKELSDLQERYRPGQVIFVVITDGQENSSKEYSNVAVKALVERQQNEYGWTFIFLAANQDAVLTGQTYGFEANSSITFNTNADSLAGVSGLLNTYVGTTRSGGSYTVTEEDRAETTQV